MINSIEKYDAHSASPNHPRINMFHTSLEMENSGEMGDLGYCTHCDGYGAFGKKCN